MTKIKNKKYKYWNWEIKRKKKDSCALSLEEKEKKEGKKPPIIRRHVQHHKKKDLMVLLKTWRKGGLSTWWRRTHHPNGVDATYMLVCNKHPSATFSNKKTFFQLKNNIMPFMILRVTKIKTVWKGTNAPRSMPCFFFLSFVRVKYIFTVP